ncbi:uncharacterized protein LOC124414441 [Diprion similis]|uniref:uncharacterized protein LOC124414441 n=1 Tax=Diprion similis TaxID=362088 RepID=UPI001EF80603|nr:uncharacterized protein LOC124414441 [Diprion similis]
MKSGVLMCMEGVAGLGPRSAVLINSRHQTVRLSQFWSRDLAATSIKLKREKVLKKVVSYCTDKGLYLVVGCDANSHHTIWVSSNTNKRGTALQEYLPSAELEILNNDHRRITFSLAADGELEPTGTHRNPRATDWPSYKEELDWRLQGPCSSLSSTSAVENEVTHLQSSIIQAFEIACPAKLKVNRPKVPWWNGPLDKLRSSSRKLLIRALKTNTDTDWAAYKGTQEEYKKLNKRSKTKAWRGLCSKIEALPLVAKLRRVFSSGPPIRLDCLTLPDGSMTECQSDIRTHMLEVHFPGSGPVAQGPPRRDGPTGRRPRGWKSAGEIVTIARIRWDIDTFDTFKSPGADGIFPALLQEGGEALVTRLNRIFRACLVLRKIPMNWREVKIFIPKTGKSSYDHAKSWRPISLISFLLKTLERLVERFIRDGALAVKPFCVHSAPTKAVGQQRRHSTT